MSDPWHDPALGFLDRDERTVRRRAERAERRRRRAARRRSVRRLSRRTAALVAMLSVLGATAYAARTVLFSETKNPAHVHQGPLVVAAAGGQGEDRWLLRLYRRGATVCRALLVSQTATSRCSPAPTGATVRASSATSPRRRWVFGLTGPDVAAVRVRVGTASRTVATSRLDAGQVAAGGLPSTIRLFIVSVARPVAEPDPPVTVRAFDRDNRPLGAPRRAAM